MLADITDRLDDDDELRFAALMLVLSILVFVAILREARGDAD
jgi:hypothetical protein